jgi:uncharacterized protein YxjI
MATADPTQEDRFYIHQQIRPIVNRYEVSTLGPDQKSAADPVCFVEQKRMKLKEDLRAFTDSSKSSEVFRIKAHQRFDPRATYSVTDAAGQKVGGLKKRFGSSLLRSTWEIHDAADNQVGWAQESSRGVALWRRFSDFIPFVGEFLALIPIPYHFDFHLGESEVRAGRMTRILGIRDRYAFDLSADSERVLDRRVALALAIGLDALQAR